MRAIHLRRALVAVVVVATSTSVLTGCDRGAPLMPLDSPTQTATAEEQLESDVLFTVAVTTTDSTGQEIHLNLVGHAPQKWNAPGRESVTNALLDQCAKPGGGTISAFGGTLNEETLQANGSTMMVIDIVSTPTGAALAAPIELQLGDPFFLIAASGDGLENPTASECFGQYQLVSTGSVSAIVNYETGSPEADLSQWRTGRYGFIAAFDSPVEFSSCTIALSPRAIEANVDDVDGWTPIEDLATECAIGYHGE